MSESVLGGKSSLQVQMIEADLAATRERMGETLEELGAQLNPERLKQQAIDTVREATIGKVQTMTRNTMDKATRAGRAVTDVVRQNPIPIAMVAAGIGWLFWNARSGSNARRVGRMSTPSRTIVNRVESGYYNKEAVNHEAGLVETVQAKAGEAMSAVQDAAHKATAGASHLASEMSEGASHLAGEISDNVQEQSTKVVNVFHQSPIAIGAIAAAVGFAAAFLVPSTQMEGELVGEARDDLVDKVRDVVHEKSEEIQHVAQRVMGEVRWTATEAARQEGLTH